MAEINSKEPDCLFASFLTPLNPGGGCNRAGFAKDALQRPLQCEPLHFVGPGANWHMAHRSGIMWGCICVYMGVYMSI